MNIFRIFKPFLKPTLNNGNVPTDLKLDYDIDYVFDVLYHLGPILQKIIITKIKLFFLYRWRYLVARVFLFGLIVTLVVLLLTVMTPIHLTTNKTTEVIIKYPSDSSMNLRNFLLQIAYCESRYNPGAKRDSSQYWGLYQLGTNARRVSGYGDVPMNVFLNHPEIQDLCMIAFLKQQKKIMQPHIDKYNGKIVDGILMTESGILALAHLGCGYAKSCLDRRIIPEFDDNGNRPRVFAKLGGYILNLEKVRYSIEDALN